MKHTKNKDSDISSNGGKSNYYINEILSDSSSDNDYFDSTLNSIYNLEYYFKKKAQKISLTDESSTSKTIGKIKKKTPLFITKNISKNDKNEDFQKTINSSNSSKIGKKRGRKSKSFVNQVNYVQHTSLKNDNKMTKIQVNYINFLIRFINEIMNQLGIKLSFVELEGKYKINIKKKYRKILKNKTIKDIILEASISKKISTKNNNYNTYIINELEREGKYIILNVLDKKLFHFFEIYYKNMTKFNLSSFELDNFEVQLPDTIKTFKDLIVDYKGDNINLYKNEMEKCAKKYFLNPK